MTICFAASYLPGRLNCLTVEDPSHAGSFDFSACLEVDRTDINDWIVSERDSTTHLFSDLAPKLDPGFTTRKAPLENDFGLSGEKPSENCKSLRTEVIPPEESGVGKWRKGDTLGASGKMPK